MNKKLLCLSTLMIFSLMKSIVSADEQKKLAQTTPETETDTGVKAEGSTLSLRPSQFIYHSLEPVIIFLTLKNIGQSNVVIFRQSPLHTFTFKILAPNGASADLTAFGKRFFESPFFAKARTTRVLKPNEALTESVELNKFYDMTVKGQYTISASRAIPRRDKEKELVSITSNSALLKLEDKTKEPEKDKK